MTWIGLLDLDRGGAVELEVDEKAHPTSVIKKLREMGLVSRYETMMSGVCPNGRQIFYMPAATIRGLFQSDKTATARAK